MRVRPAFVQGTQAAMMIVWLILAVAVVAGIGVYSLVRRRRARRP
jgi:hypothetical protein